MKKLFYRLPSNRSFTRLLSILAFAALTFFVLDRAYAAPPIFGSGGTTSRFKSIATDTDLVCNFDDPRSTLLITEIESPPSFTMETPQDKVIICWEQDRNSSNRGPDIEFTLKQIAMLPNDGGSNGLVVRSVNNTDGTRTVTWEFVVDNAGGSNTELLEWHLAPKNQNDGVCTDIPQGQTCAVRLGVPASPRVSDFPDRDVTADADGIPDFDKDGVVFRYTELVLANGTRLPQTLLFGPCHTGSFLVTDSILCERSVRIGSVKQVLNTRTEGEIPGVQPVQVEIKPETINMSQTSGTHDIRILGEATLNPPPVATLFVNGVSMEGQFTSDSTSSVNGDQFKDFIAKVNRPAFITGLICSNGLARVVVTGTFDDVNNTPFRGEDTIACNN